MEKEKNEDIQTDKEIYEAKLKVRLISKWMIIETRWNVDLKKQGDYRFETGNIEVEDNFGKRNKEN